MTKTRVVLRMAYDSHDAASLESGLSCSDASRTQQSATEESDINTIVRRFGLTGKLPDNVAAPTYAIFDEVYDFQTAMNAVRSASVSFMSMPADVRARFHNDPHEFVEFCSDESNRSEAIKMGLVMPPPAEPAPEAPAAVQAASVGGDASGKGASARPQP
jgi:phage internal scaffolding protein